MIKNFRAPKEIGNLDMNAVAYGRIRNTNAIVMHNAEVDVRKQTKRQDKILRKYLARRVQAEVRSYPTKEVTDGVAPAAPDSEAV